MSYSIEDYGTMIADPLRRAAFHDAMARVIKPGAVVLDLGAGVGILSVLACKLGAARVYAVDTNPAIKLLPACAKRNGVAGKIVSFHGDSRKFHMSEKADLIIADLRGIVPFFDGSIDVMRDACARFLKPQGVVLPATDRIHIAPVSEPRARGHQHKLWRDHDLGLDLSSVAEFCLGAAIRSTATAADLLGEPGLWGVTEWGPAPQLALADEVQLLVSRDGLLDGFLEWFDLGFVDGISLTNRPGERDLVYGRCCFTLSTPIPVSRGDRICLRLHLHPTATPELWTWAGVVHDASGVQKARFSDSTFKRSAITLERPAG